MFDILAKDGAPFSEEIWKSIDETVVATVRRILTGRRFLPITGPMGVGKQFTKIDGLNKKEEFRDGYVVTTGRQVVEIPQIYEDFRLLGRDLAAADESVGRLDLSAAMVAAQKLALREDRMIFFGIPEIGLEGLLTAKGVQTVRRSDWSKGEGAFQDVYTGITMLEQATRLGRMSLITSPDLFLQLQRIQSGTGVLESDRIRRVLTGKMLKSTVLKEGTALLVAGEPEFVDLAIGQDIATAFTEAVDMNYHFRVMETALLRIKSPDAVVVFQGGA